MGATTQKSIKVITQSRYSFVHPKSNEPFQLSCWRYSEEDLQSRLQIEGQSMNWPFKLYSDEGYIFALIQNTSNQHQERKQNQNSKREFWNQLGSMKITVSLIEFLYSFANKEIEEYFSTLIELENKSKYIKDQLSLTIYIYPGENLSSYAKLKLFSRAVDLERYISRGGICAISKLYHDYETFTDLRKEVKLQGEIKSKNDEFYLDLSTLIEERIKNTDDEKIKAQIQQRQLKGLFQRLSKFSLIKKLLFFPYISNYNKYQLLLTPVNKPVYPLVDSSNWLNHKNLIIHSEPINIKQSEIKNPLKQRYQKQKQDQIPRLSQSNLNESLPFACQITQINIRQRKKDGLQFLNESLSIADLTGLGQKVSNFIKISCDEQDYIILTDYPSIRQYSKCQEHNIRFIINNSASLCYNYYINDIEHIWNYVTPLPNKPPSDYVLFQYNIQHLMEEITEKIIQRTSGNKKGDKLNNRVAIYSYNSPFSDENCALVIGYLICRYLYTFQKACDIVNRHFKQYKKSKEAHLSLHKLYQEQLLTLQGRILISSLSNYGVNLNNTFWRAYQVSNNHCHPSQILINRYIGQISNLNQIQSLPNHGQHVYIVISHQVIPILSAIIEKWEKDATTKIPQGLTGIKIFVGKEFQFKEEYIQKAKEMIAPILKYQFINRGKNKASFNNEFLLKFIREIGIVNTQVENIEKSFRKPQPFTPLYLGFEQQMPGRPIEKISQPYNSKQKLTFKYPYLRPTWQPIKDDQYYFIIQIKQQGASIQIVKGKNWIGLEVDKEVFFENIVKLYLQNFDQSKIWITSQGEQSLFGDQIDL